MGSSHLLTFELNINKSSATIKIKTFSNLNNIKFCFVYNLNYLKSNMIKTIPV